MTISSALRTASTAYRTHVAPRIQNTMAQIPPSVKIAITAGGICSAIAVGHRKKDEWLADAVQNPNPSDFALLKQKVALTLGADPNTFRDEKGNSLLHLEAGSYRDHRATQGLLAAGASANAQNESGEVPLHKANTPAKIQLLVKAGANPKAMNKDGLDPLCASAERFSLFPQESNFQNLN